MVSTLHRDLEAAGYRPVPIPTDGKVAYTGWLPPQDDDWDGYDPDDRAPCLVCDGSGRVINCVDDVCHGRGHCTHAPPSGNLVCHECEGTGFSHYYGPMPVYEQYLVLLEQAVFEQLDNPPRYRHWRAMDWSDPARVGPYHRMVAGLEEEYRAVMSVWRNVSQVPPDVDPAHAC